MRYLGIDYGTKKIGIAMSDEGGSFASPHSVIPNDSYFLTKLKKICIDNEIKELVVGESTNYDGSDNKLMAELRPLVFELKENLGLEVSFEPEFYTSKQAERDIGKDYLHDARAAAIILQSFLDKKRHVRLA